MDKEDDDGGYDSDFPSYIDEEITGPMKYVSNVQKSLTNMTESHSKQIKWAVLGCVYILYMTFLSMLSKKTFD